MGNVLPSLAIGLGLPPGSLMWRLEGLGTRLHIHCYSLQTPPPPLPTLQALAELRGKTEDIPCIIGGQEVRTGKTRDQLCVSKDCSV